MIRWVRDLYRRVQLLRALLAVVKIYEAEVVAETLKWEREREHVAKYGDK